MGINSHEQESQLAVSKTHDVMNGIKAAQCTQAIMRMMGNGDNDALIPIFVCARGLGDWAVAKKKQRDKEFDLALKISSKIHADYLAQLSDLEQYYRDQAHEHREAAQTIRDGEEYQNTAVTLGHLEELLTSNDPEAMQHELERRGVDIPKDADAAAILLLLQDELMAERLKFDEMEAEAQRHERQAEKSDRQADIVQEEAKKLGEEIEIGVPVEDALERSKNRMAALSKVREDLWRSNNIETAEKADTVHKTARNAHGETPSDVTAPKFTTDM